MLTEILTYKNEDCGSNNIYYEYCFILAWNFVYHVQGRIELRVFWNTVLRSILYLFLKRKVTAGWRKWRKEQLLCWHTTPHHPHYSNKVWEVEKERVRDTYGGHEKCMHVLEWKPKGKGNLEDLDGIHKNLS
jgi:hypothetical protein